MRPRDIRTNLVNESQTKVHQKLSSKSIMFRLGSGAQTGLGVLDCGNTADVLEHAQILKDSEYCPDKDYPQETDLACKTFERFQ
ncbi:hypothetical protein CHS0354_034553 [Potamilus streckersoni]|uniref:Uncharacterized protein n=1 Tax=Potamilus streckersoni TaxID=2493646 RepID=A0AAE0W271_9BIVA|nr:hypothetical protein CHS0354_034553 [Potamilus streckersoni]